MGSRSLRRTFYYGVFEYPLKSGKWYKGSYTPLITKEIYDKTQEVMNHHQRTKGRKWEVSSFAFNRLLHCGACGSGITARVMNKNYKNGTTTVYRYYFCDHGKDIDCKELSINELDLIAQVANLFAKMELDLIGTKAQLEAEIERWYRFEAFIDGTPVSERPPERKEVDLREYAKAIFEDGTLDEKREILKNLKSHLLLKNKQVYLDTIAPSET